MVETPAAFAMSFKRTTRGRKGTPDEEQAGVRSGFPFPGTLHFHPFVGSPLGYRFRHIVKLLPLLLSGLVVSLTSACQRKSTLKFSEVAAGLDYGNESVTDVPWSIHVVRVDRTVPANSLQSLHAQGRAVGLSPLSEQLQWLPTTLGTPMAAVNGDFYQRERAFQGDPRGLQIVQGELLSAPKGGVAFWLDGSGSPWTTNVTPHLQITWPDGRATAFGLNEERPPGNLVLFTPALGASTHTTDGEEWILGPAENGPWLPLQLNQTYSAKVLATRSTGNTPLAPGLLVLSAGPQLAKTLPRLETNAILRIATASAPVVADAQVAIGGGPVLVRAGKPQPLPRPTGSAEAYEFSSMTERHPRTAVGWNQRYLFLVEVDGRQKGLSVGMTLAELARYLVSLGCDEAMNLDGGGSATLWCDGRVRNKPCDGRERPVANSLVVVRRRDAERPDNAAKPADPSAAPR